MRPLAERAPDRFAVRLTYDEGLAHKIEAGADIFLMPSRFEPCGLTQMYSLRYGTVPVVRSTGGLVDTVEPWDPRDRRGHRLPLRQPGRYRPDVGPRPGLGRAPDAQAWEQLVRNGMARDFSWDRSARGLRRPYERAMAKV